MKTIEEKIKKLVDLRIKISEMQSSLRFEEGDVIIKIDSANDAIIRVDDKKLSVSLDTLKTIQKPLNKAMPEGISNDK